MVIFSLCKKSCLTCSALVTETKFRSAANGVEFSGVYNFDDKEPHVLNCQSVNLVYMLQCKNCTCQYVGETVQRLKDRMSGHRGSTNPKSKNSGNFRLRQHYACSDGACSNFKIFIIQKLPGNGRTKNLQENSKLFKIDPEITQIRKVHEDNWIRSLHTQYPYGCNDRIDSLENKAIYNCEFAKFKSAKSKRRRSWANKARSTVVDIVNIVNILFGFVNCEFSTSLIIDAKRVLFPLSRDILILVRDSYLDKVFSDNIIKHEILRKHMHFVIADLLMYKIKPFNDKISSPKKSKSKVNFKLLFVNKTLDMINLPRIIRDASLRNLVSFCKTKLPSVVFSYKSSIAHKIFNYEL